MAKFNIDKIKKQAVEVESTVKMESTKLGEGLLNETSKTFSVSEATEEQYINLEDIEENPLNNYSIREEEIIDLMTSIKMIGLQQALCVLSNPDGASKKYRLTTGHKRFIALKRLHESGDWGKQVKCIINDINNIDLPISDKSKERLLIRDTNAKQRKYTDADIIQEAKELDEFYSELRASGKDRIVLSNGKEIQLKGTKNRELIADALLKSPAQIEKARRIEKKGAVEVKQAIEQGILNINTASDVVNLPEPEQKKFIAEQEKKTQEKITTHDVENFKKQMVQSSKEMDTITITAHDFAKDLAELKRLFLKEKISLTQKEYQLYNKAITQIKKIVS